MVADSISTPDFSAVPKSSPWPAYVPAAILIAGLFLGFARTGLFAYFTSDDLMNMYQAYRKPIREILLENVLYCTPAYRPMGSLVYSLLYRVAGFHPLPFRLTCFALIFSNLFILYRAAAAIGSKEAGVLAALFASYNAGFSDLYQSTGTIYDVLCFTFYFLAFGMYAAIRRRGGYLMPRELVLFLALYVCALNSKEMAVTLPAILIAYELVLGRPSKEFIKRWTPAAVSAVMTAPYLVAKFSASSPFAGNEAYRNHLGLRTYLRAFAHYLALLTYLPWDALNVASAVLILILLAAIAALARSRCLGFLWLFIVISLLPIAFVPLRSAYAMYVPSFGLAVFLAVVVIRARTELAKRLASNSGALSAQARRILRVDTFAICFIVLLAAHGSQPPLEPGREDALVRSTALQITARLHPKQNSKPRILFLDDPFPRDNYDLFYIFALSNRIHDPAVDTLKTMPAGTSQPRIDSYDYVFSFEGDRLIQVKP